MHINDYKCVVQSDELGEKTRAVFKNIFQI